MGFEGGFAEATFYKLRKHYAGSIPSEARRLGQLEEESRKLKRIVADLSRDEAALYLPF